MRRIKKIKRRHKLVSTAGIAILAGFAIFLLCQRRAPPVSLPDRVPKHPADPGRLSLLQIKDGQLLNMRDNTLPNYADIQFVDGRTRFNQASRIFLPGFITVPVEDNLTLDKGSIAFWIQKQNWATQTDDWFFRVDISGPSPFIDNFQVRKWIDDNLYWGFELLRGIYPVGQLDTNSWHLFVVTWDFGDLMSLYIDGSTIQQITLPEVTITNTLPYMRWGEWGGLDCKCVMEDMQTFNYALSAEQVLELYNSRFPVSFYEPGPQR